LLFVEIFAVKKGIILRIALSFLLLVCLFNSVQSQSFNYPEIFGDNWKKAEAFERDNRIWMEPVLAKNNISYPLAIGIIFPELVRYSAIRDKMEVTLLKALYINMGEEYANFSIGQFQMKPSFAEMIREQSRTATGRKSGIEFKSRNDYKSIYDFRRSIVTDLDDPETEFSYLVAFIKICEKKYKTERKEQTEKLKFLATAYNYGIDKSASQIENMANRRFFNTKLFKTENYSYADVSLYWFSNFIPDK
jgi:hypothetical protein